MTTSFTQDILMIYSSGRKEKLNNFLTNLNRMHNSIKLDQKLNTINWIFRYSGMEVNNGKESDNV